MELVDGILGAQAPLKLVEELLEVGDVEFEGLEVAGQPLGCPVLADCLAEACEVVSWLASGKKSDGCVVWKG